MTLWKPTNDSCLLQSVRAIFNQVCFVLTCESGNDAGDDDDDNDDNEDVGDEDDDEIFSLGKVSTRERRSILLTLLCQTEKVLSGGISPNPPKTASFFSET